MKTSFLATKASGAALCSSFIAKKCHPLLIKLALLQRRRSFLKQRLAAAASAPLNAVFKGSSSRSCLPLLPPREERGAELGERDARRLYVSATLPRRKV